MQVSPGFFITSEGALHKWENNAKAIIYSIVLLVVEKLKTENKHA